MENKINNILDKLNEYYDDIKERYRLDPKNEYLRGAYGALSETLDIIDELLDEE